MEKQKRGGRTEGQGMRAGWIQHLLIVVALTGSILSARMPFSEAASPTAMRVILNLPYHSGPDFDPEYQTLDLYLPEGMSDFPLVFFLHGGGWRAGDKTEEGRVNFIQLCIAQGIGVASANYRLSPAVKHPAHIQDAALAFAWLHKNAASYGIDRTNIFAAGHSAGAHLVSLLALDPKYLQDRGLSSKSIRGVIAMSGIYDLREFFEPGAAPSRRDEAFGRDAATLREASPALKLRLGSVDLPPFLVTYASNDLFGLAEQAKNFYSLLLNGGQAAQLVQIPGRNHSNVIAEIGRQVIVSDTDGRPILPMDDLLGPALIRFIRKVQDGSFSSDFHSVWPPGGPATVSRLPAPAMRVTKDLRYDSGPGSDAKLNALDLYLPEGGTNSPILFEVHGGRWRVGDKSGISTALVHLFVRQGWAVVSVNYRLSPAVKHPTHIEDIARALGWIHRNGSQHGLDRNRIVLFGSSAGGQLVSLLALDSRYLQREEVPAEAIRGVISTSGIYDIPRWLEPGKVPTGKEQAFADVAAEEDASPIRYLRNGAAPFLITIADRDLYLIPEQSHAFYSAMIKRGLRARLLQLPDRTHFDYSSGVGQPPIVLVDDTLGVELVSFASESIQLPKR